MAQTVTLTDATQTVTAVVTENHPVLYSGDETLRQAVLRVRDLNAAEPINIVLFDADVAPYLKRLTVTLIDARVARYRFEDVDPDLERFIIEFTGATWEETSLDLLNILKNGVLELNKPFPMTTFTHDLL